MRFSRVLTILTILALALLLGWAMLWKVSDADVWWHIRAGQLMLELRGLIDTDPFAYTRVGLPYLATHEWLAQVIIAGFYQLGGAHALIGLRILLTLLTAGVVLLIDRRNLWPNAFVVCAAILVFRQHFIERPQLFTNVCFAVTLVLTFRILEIPQEEAKKRRTIFVALFANTVIWANLHGGAAILAPMLLGTVFVQKLLDAAWEGRLRARAEKKHLISLLLWCVFLACALLLTPNFFENITYLRLLMTDQTAQFINEWNPRAWPQYLLWIGPFWGIALGSLIAGRKSPVAVMLLLLGTGYLSRTAERHEILFVLTALACTFYELKFSERWQEFLARVRQKPLVASGVTVLAFGLLLWLNAPYHAFLLRRNLAGFGEFAPVAAAVDFLEERGIQERLFNSYTAGGYLLFRGHSVFVDGRNVDYGYEFLSSALAARYDPNIFRELAGKHGFTVAILERHTEDNQDDPAFRFLETDPNWALVFVDDWSAVYLQRVPSGNAPVHALRIAELGYRFVTPTLLDRGVLPSQLSQQDLTTFEAELQRAVAQDRQGIRSRVLLAKLYRSLGKFDEANTLAREASMRAPYRYEPHEILATIAANEERWQDAALEFEMTLELSRHLPITPPYAAIAEVFERAGMLEKAAEFRQNAAEVGRP